VTEGHDQGPQADRTRPLMFGYLRVRELAPGIAPADIWPAFNQYAEKEGYALAGVYVERDCSAPIAFGGLLDAVKQHSAQAVAVPTLEHLAVLGPNARPTLDGLVRRATGAQVLVMDW
jgi:hypothetical protein